MVELTRIEGKDLFKRLEVARYERKLISSWEEESGNTVPSAEAVPSEFSPGPHLYFPDGDDHDSTLRLHPHGTSEVRGTIELAFAREVLEMPSNEYNVQDKLSNNLSSTVLRMVVPPNCTPAA
eukprot:2788102-Rhodomonas_salina.2